MVLYRVLNETKFIWVDTDTDYFWWICVPLASLIGLISNLACFLTFNSPEFKSKSKIKANMYGYLKIEAFFIILNLSLQIFRFIVFEKTVRLNLLSKIYELYMLWILAGMLEMSALLSHLASTIDFYMIIKNKEIDFKWFQNVSKYFIAILMFVLSFLSFSYMIFCFKVNSWKIESLNEFNQTITDLIYTIDETEFQKTRIKTVIEIVAFVTRDCLINIVILFLNILIVVHVKKSLKKKQRIIYKPSITSIQIRENQLEVNKKINSIDTKAMLMVIMTCLNNAFGRTPVLVVFILRNFLNSDFINNRLNKLACLAVFISYILNLFIYFFTNSIFRRVFKRGLLKVFSLARGLNFLLDLRKYFSNNVNSITNQ